MLCLLLFTWTDQDWSAKRVALFATEYNNIIHVLSNNRCITFWGFLIPQVIDVFCDFSLIYDLISIL